MDRFIIIPDSFKGTMSAIEVCEIMGDAVLANNKNAQVKSIPVADGGEGTVDCFLTAMGGEKVRINAQNPFGKPMNAFFGILPDSETAIIEMAACAGLPLVEGTKDPKRATTYGVGEIILEAVSKGAKRVLIGLGGSATNDGGCGAAAAVGVRFFDKSGSRFVPTGGNLTDIDRIDASSLDSRLGQIEIIAMCDIDNPMFGENGAAYVFAPQKGADSETVKLLDEGLKHLAAIIERDLGVDVANVPGSGAAGAMGAGMLAFFNAKLQRGIDVVLDTVGFDACLRDTDIVFTGEGKFDSQSLQGKAISGISSRAKAAGVPIIVVAGAIDADIEEVYRDYVTAAFSITRMPAPFSEIRHKSKENLRFAMDNILQVLNLNN